MTANKLKLNDDKTEFLVCGTASALKKVTTISIKIGSKTIMKSSTVRNIGVVFDTELKMESHVNSICKRCWFHLYCIGKIRSYMTEQQTAAVIHAFVTSRLDNSNALLFGLPSKLVDKLQRIHNAAAKLLTKSKKYDHVTPILQQLHWLPISQRIIFKVLLLTFKALNGDGPIYLKDLTMFYKPSRLLRSASDTSLLAVPKTKLKTYGDRAFSVAGPVLWNNLPAYIKSSQNVNSFKRDLKTHLFKEYFY